MKFPKTGLTAIKRALGIQEPKLDGEKPKKRPTSPEDIQYNRIAKRLGRDTDNVLERDRSTEYLLGIALKLDLKEAKQILSDALKEHQNDRGFPDTEVNVLRKLIAGPPQYKGDDYEFDVKAEAAIIHWFSPYAEVRAVTDAEDTQEPCESIRAYFLGLLWGVIAQFTNTYFYSRGTVTLDAVVCQTLAFPCGLFLAKILPDWRASFAGMTFSLNPGPWSYKEQTLVTIMVSMAAPSGNVVQTIQTQRVYYGDTWMSAGYILLMTLSSQLVGIGFAGFLRRSAIYPIQAVWPSTFPKLALNRALMEKRGSVPMEKKAQGATLTTWKLSKKSFFILAFFAMFLTYWLPGYVFQGLSLFSWISWIKPENFTLAAITGTQTGLGFNPLPTFDWYIINANYPLNIPFYVYFQQYIGTFIGGLLIIIIYFTNRKWTAYLPINTQGLFDHAGYSYQTSAVMTNGRFDKIKYLDYSPAFYSAGILVRYGAYFAMYPFVFCYVCLDQHKLIWRAYGRISKDTGRRTVGLVERIISLFRGDWKGATKESPNKGSVYEGFDDVFVRAASKYPKVPSWWFYLIALVCSLLAIVIVKIYQLGAPVWVVFLVLGLNLGFLVPLNLIYAITGSTVGLAILFQLIVGYTLPGNYEALMFASCFGNSIDQQATAYASDQKLGHYAHIPPRAVFRGQVISALASSLVAFAVMYGINTHGSEVCSHAAAQDFQCDDGSLEYYGDTVEWSLIGPRRVLLQQYPTLRWMFLVGFGIAVVWWSVKTFGPKIRTAVKEKAPGVVYKVLNYAAFIPISGLNSVEPAYIGLGLLVWGYLNLSYYTTGLYLSFFFMYYLKRFKPGFWEKYTYVLSSAFTAGMTLMSVILFLATRKVPDVNWWGNNIINAGVDGGNGNQTALKALPPKGYFGPDFWY